MFVTKSSSWWIVICTFWALGGIPPCFGTSVVFVLGQKQLMVAADSKTYGGDDEHAMADTCKIFISQNRVVFANAGPLNDGTAWFIDIARDILRSAGNVSEAAARFSGLVRPRLERLADQERLKFPEYFASHIEGKPWFQASFVSVESPGPRVALRTYRPDHNASGVHIRVERSDCFATACPAYFAIGRFDKIDRAMKIPEIRSKPIVELVKYLIGLEISADPTHVGPPIAVLHVNGSGSNWLERGKCDQ
jgi:hypothetical protein